MTAGNDNRPPAGAPAGPGLGWVLFGFSGRIDREIYWLGLGLTWTAVLGVSSMFVASTGEPGMGAAMMFAGLASLWPEMALKAKRLQDRGLPGLLCLLNLVPVFGLAWTVIVGLIPGDPRANRYGPPMS